MVNLTNYRILKYSYSFSSNDFEEKLWDKMNESERRWAMKLTLDGINDTGGDNEMSWDMVLLEPKLQSKIDEVLKKYDIQYEIEDLTNMLDDYQEYFSEQFMSKVNSFLKYELDVDGVLDRILEVGMDNITPFEKYFLDKNKEWDER
jgi:hypothetical protein